MTQIATDTPADRAHAAFRGPLLGALVLLALVAWIFRDFFGRQILWAIREQADWGHTLVIPFVAGYFVYLRREQLLGRPFRTTWIGFVPIVLGVGWYTLCSIGPQVLAHHNLRAVGVALTITGIVILFCGLRAMVWLWFPLAYLFVFGQTISYRLMEIVTFEMQDITARGAYAVFAILGTDIEREGNTLYIFDNGERKPLNIAEACSGMRMLMAFMALGVAMAYTGLQHNWQRVVVVLMGVPTAIFVNILRVVSLGFLAIINVNFAAGDFHSFVGLVWLLPAFLIYLGIIWIVRHLVVEQPVASVAATEQSS